MYTVQLSNKLQHLLVEYPIFAQCSYLYAADIIAGKSISLTPAYDCV